MLLSLFSRFALLIVVAKAAIGVVHAQNNDLDSTGVNSTNTLEEIEVVAGAFAGTGEVEHREFTGSHRRIEGQELERRDVTIAEILSFESGVQSRQSGGFGAFSSITVRAATAAQTGIYLDGILLNSGGNAVVDLSMLDLLNVDSVDIYRGTTPQQFGRGTIGGGINLVSASVDDDAAQNKVLAGIGSFDTERLQFSHRSRHEDWDVVGAFSFQQSENDYPFTDSNGTPLNPDDDTRQRRNNAAVRLVSALARAGLQWTPDTRTDFLAQATSREQGIPEARNAASNRATLDTDAVRLQLNHTVDGIGLWNSRHTLFLHEDDQVFDDRLGQIGLGLQNTQSDGLTVGIKTYWEHLGDTRTTGFSLEARRETLDTIDLLDDDFNFDVERLAVNASVFTTLFAKSDRLLITPALQIQLSDDQYERVTRLDETSRDEGVLSPQLGIRYDLDDNLSFRSNIGRFFREPSFSELFVSRGLLQGNTDLQPEEGINADIGLTWSPRTGLSIDASLFASWRDELIVTVFDARRVGRTLNVGDARIVGVELGGDWRINSKWSARGNVTLQDARSVEDFDAFDGQQLPGEAQYAAYFKLQYKHKAWRAFAEANGSWNRFFDQANVLPADDQWLQNIGIDWQYSGVTVSATINNLADRNFEDFFGFPRTGRSFTLSLSTYL